MQRGGAENGRRCWGTRARTGARKRAHTHTQQHTHQPHHLTTAPPQEHGRRSVRVHWTVTETVRKQAKSGQRCSKWSKVVKSGQHLSNSGLKPITDSHGPTATPVDPKRQACLTAVKKSGQKQRSKTADKNSGRKQRSKTAVENSGRKQRSNTAVKNSGRKQRSKTAVTDRPTRWSTRPPPQSPTRPYPLSSSICLTRQP